MHLFGELWEKGLKSYPDKAPVEVNYLMRGLLFLIQNLKKHKTTEDTKEQIIKLSAIISYSYGLYEKEKIFVFSAVNTF